MMIGEQDGFEPPIQRGTHRFAHSPEEYGESEDVFGLGDAGCSCPPVNEKNLSMIGLGGILAAFGVKTGNPTVDLVLRILGGAAAGLGVLDVIRGFRSKAPDREIEESEKKAPSTLEPMRGLGSVWYDETGGNKYLNRFAHLLARQHRPGALGQIEYWIMDPEDPHEPMIRSQCPPFMVAPGYVIAQKGPKGRLIKTPVEPPTMWGVGHLGFWEVLSPDGTRIAAMRCRPHDVERTLVVKQVVRGMPGGPHEILRRSGAAPYPEGTIRERRGPLFTTRRG